MSVLGESFAVSNENVSPAVVLLVDDSPNVLRLYRKHLEKAGYKVICASNAEKALEILSSESIDILLSDHSMPRISGSELLRRTSKISPTTIRVLFSGVADMTIAEEAFSKARAHGFLAKPFSGQHLRNVVREFLEQKSELYSAQQFPIAMVLRSKHEIEAVFDSITDPTAVVDKNFTVVRANQAFADFAGKSFKELLGKTCAETVPDFACPASVKALQTTFEEKRPCSRELNGKFGKVFKAYFFPVMESDGIENAVARFQDVSTEKDLEQQLLQSEKMASIGQLAAGIAHEINNPVGFILSNMNRLGEYGKILSKFGAESKEILDLVRKGESDPIDAWKEHSEAWESAELDYILEDVAAIASECKEGAERIRTIVAGMRAFSHPDTAGFEYADLNEGIKSTLNIIWNELKYNCEIIAEYGDIPPVYCKQQQINQVVMNLLVNARQAIEGVGTICIRTWREGDRAFISVVDSGEGIAKENMSKLFDPFFTTKEVGKGTGLGLHIVAGIVKNHGGEIKVESSPGEGAAFILSLPINPRE